MKSIVNEESEPQLSVGRYTAKEHLRQSQLAPLLLLLAGDWNAADGNPRVTSLFGSKQSIRARAKLSQTGGQPIAVEATQSPEPLDNRPFHGQATIASDIRTLRAQLAQAQRMATVGKLAGGVTHDVNNLLMVMNAHSELALAGAAPETKHHLEQILEAIQRAGKLTHQLLAVGRERAVQPTVVSLNAVLRDLEELLGCLIRKDIELRLVLDENLDLCKIDSAQLQQILMNLVVNARDAMPNGGRLFIETKNEDVGSSLSGPCLARPGRFVTIALRDTGVGMDKATREHIFEPFFTTKEISRGTGLGLSTVDDIVKQNGGYVAVESEIGCGTTLKIYLPAITG